MSDTVFARGGWIPAVVESGGALRLRLGAGADALHSPRTFSFPLDERHVDVLRGDLGRHLLLWSAILPLCDAAGIDGPLDEEAAAALLDPILLGHPADVDRLLRGMRVDDASLARHGADVAMLARGQYVDAMHSATETSDPRRGHEYVANRWRARNGVQLSPLDVAVLKYVGHYLHGSTLPSRHPEDVDPEMLPKVLRIVATGEKACDVRPPVLDSYDDKAPRSRDWKRVERAVDQAVRRAHPRLAVDARRSVVWLMCSEAVGRVR